MSQTTTSPESASSEGSPNPFVDCAQDLQTLDAAVRELLETAAILQLPPLPQRHWYEVLSRKLLPQLSGEPFLVAAVVGGTNIGKSVVFNHLAGSSVSAISPLASGTKHPVCLIPPGFGERHDLQQVFQGFTLIPWTESASALETHEAHHLYWKESPLLPPNLIVLDTPDIDSDAAVNWHRADCVRHAADVLVAVLTQQKYNDAAVKQFFRKVATDDKAVIVVFNQCLLPEDETYWPMWLGTFSEETAIRPDLVYVAPNDRRAADGLRLPFYQREWPAVPRAADEPPGEPHNLRHDLTQLHFSQIKFRTLSGSLHTVLDEMHGAPSFLREVLARSSDFHSAAQLLTSQQLAKIPNWPSISNRLLVQEIRHWWREHRQGWSRSIHDFYNVIGDTVWKGVSWAKGKISGPEPDPWADYIRLERQVILTALENLFDGLYQLSELGNDLLRPRLSRLLAGETRARVLREVQAAHQQINLQPELERVVAQEMRSFRENSPQLFEFLKQLDNLAAAARPMTSVVLFFAGGGPLGDALAPVAHDALLQTVLHVAGGTGAVVAGEAALTGTGATVRTIEAHFRQLHTAFMRVRAEWLAKFLKEQLLGDLQQELEFAASLSTSAPYQQVVSAIARLRQTTAGVLHTH